MNAFDDARMVEARSVTLLRPFMDDLSGKYVLTSKGTLAPYLQRTCGDLLFNDRNERLWAVELKAEQRFTGNLFLETWSNRNLDDHRSHADRGCTMGWLYESRADLLFYHFLDADKLYLLNLWALKRWAFVRPSAARSESANRVPPGELVGRIYDFPEREQAKRTQRNDTRGRIVPLGVLRKEMQIPPRCESVVQLSHLLLAQGVTR